MTRSSGSDSIRGDLDFVDALERKEQFDEIFLRGLTRLFEDVTYSIGDCRVKQHAAHLEAREVHAHGLARFKDGAISSISCGGNSRNASCDTAVSDGKL